MVPIGTVVRRQRGPTLTCGSAQFVAATVVEVCRAVSQRRPGCFAVEMDCVVEVVGYCARAVVERGAEGHGDGAGA